MRSNDYVETMIAMDEKRDHEQAARRGQRVAELADAVAGRMFGSGRWSRADCLELRREIVALAVEVWYPGLAVDLPGDPT